MALFDSLGFSWDRGSIPRELPRASVERSTFRFARMLPEYVWDAGVLEGNPFTFPEVKTLLDGVTVGGRKLSDQEQILNLAQSSKHYPAARPDASRIPQLNRTNVETRRPKQECLPKTMRRRAVQNWRKLYGPEAAAADPAVDGDEQGVPRRGRDTDLDPSG